MCPLSVPKSHQFHHDVIGCHCFCSLFSFVNGSSIMRDTEETIVTDGEWLVCPSDSPIAGRDFLLKRVLGCFSGQAIVVGFIESAVVIVYEKCNVKVDCLITMTWVYNSFTRSWLVSPPFQRYDGSLVVEYTEYTQGKLFCCW